MRHFTTSEFWNYYNKLPPHIKSLADKNFKLLKQNPQHPSLNLKKNQKILVCSNGSLFDRHLSRLFSFRCLLGGKLKVGSVLDRLVELAAGAIEKPGAGTGRESAAHSVFTAAFS